jgi:hypothetical protein
VDQRDEVLHRIERAESEEEVLQHTHLSLPDQPHVPTRSAVPASRSEACILGSDHRLAVSCSGLHHAGIRHAPRSSRVQRQPPPAFRVPENDGRGKTSPR